MFLFRDLLEASTNVSPLGVQTLPHRTPVRNQANLKKQFSVSGKYASLLSFLALDETIKLMCVKYRDEVCD